MRYLAFPLSVMLLTAHIHAEEFVFHHENVLGTSAELRIHTTSRQIADAAEEQVLTQIDRYARLLSTYDPNSEVTRWIAGELGTKVSSELYDLLALCEQFESQTDGAFNPRVGTATALWKRAAAEGELPDDNDLRIAAQRASRPAWRLDAETRGALILESGTKSLTFDAIAKGYIVDRVTESALETASARFRTSPFKPVRTFSMSEARMSSSSSDWTELIETSVSPRSFQSLVTDSRKTRLPVFQAVEQSTQSTSV